MSFPRYPAYNNSGVEWLGEVPVHWEIKRLKQVCRAFPSNVDKKSYDGQEPVKLCNYVDVYYNDVITVDIPFMEATASHEEVAKFTLVPGDTIITKDSETADDIAIAAYIPQELPGVVCGYHLTIVRPSAVMAGRFVKRLFDSQFLKSQFAVAANGLTRVGLSQYAIDNALFPVPPLPEQSAIAAFLDRQTAKIDALVAEQEKLIALLAEKRQAVISHAVTKGLNPAAPMKDSGIEWLGKVPGHWLPKKLKYITTFSGGGTPSRENMAYWNGKIPWVSPKDMKTEEIVGAEEFITEDGLANSTAGLIPSGTVLIVVRSGILKHTIPVAINSTEVALNQDMKAMTFLENACFSRFFLRWVQGLNDELLLAWAKQGATVESIEQEYLANTIIALPPLPEQFAIVAFLDTETTRLDALTAEARRAIDLLKEHRSALISAAVTGKIDVRGLVNVEAA